MIKDITIGQYFPGKSVLHRLDPRIKLLLTVLYIVMLFSASGFVGLGIGIVFLVFAFAISGIPIKMMVKGVKPILPVIIFTGILNLFFISTGNVIFSLGFIKITDDGLSTMIFMAVRIVFLICGTSLLTYTTSPIALTDAIERVLSPLRVFHFPAHEIAMMMTIALRFIPTLIEETDKIMSAQKARGADFESGSIINRAKALIPVLIPLFVSAFRRAEELALAMECRCYRGGEGRTRMKQLKTTYLDYIALAVTVLFLVLIILANIFIPI
ncbi:MAG: energy-coupling factor transporter transmembrane protein EcfT [Oscillospiraceae bacterium]|nr:energy-coupling factor transporter transmembrane protein EcfT [Oscillospiraceae bacterium]